MEHFFNASLGPKKHSFEFWIIKEQSPIALHCVIVSIQLDIVPETFRVSFSDLQKTNALWHAVCFVLQVVLKSKTVEKIIQTDKNDGIDTNDHRKSASHFISANSIIPNTNEQVFSKLSNTNMTFSWNIEHNGHVSGEFTVQCDPGSA